jgi:dihydroorotase
MSHLLKNVQVIDKDSTFHLEKRDILIENGVIQKISKSIPTSDHEIIEGEDLSVSIGFADLNCHIYQPGFEYREDMKSGLAAAVNGGFTTVSIMPNTDPVIDTKGQVAYLKSLANKNIVSVVPIGAISKDCKGKDLAEIYDMQSENIFCFSDGHKSINDAGMMERALLYVKKFDGVVMNHPDLGNISHGGLMNEGILSTKLGLQASPKLAEELMVARDIYLAEHCDSRIHFINVSTLNSVKQIKEAKKKGVKVTAAVNAYNLLLDDSFLNEYDTNFKVNPHLRTKEDIKALITGLKDGTIDVISSGHNPKHTDEKKVEFENADFGISALDSAFAVARKATEKYLSLEELIEKFTDNPRKILNLECPTIKVGEKANLVVFNAEKENVFSEVDIKSKSKNTPFIGMELKGEIIAVFNNKKVK